MIRSLLALLALFAAVLPTTGALADSWTDGQTEWARQGSRHGAWDCNGDCPSGRHPSHAAAGPAPRRHVGRAGFDGTWSVSAAGPCSGAGTSQVMISGGRIMGQNGGSGHVTPGGSVSTVGVVNGVTVVGEGRISGQFGSGIYRQSDGCSSSWDAVKL